MKTLNQFLQESEQQSKKQKFQKIAAALDKYVASEKYDSRTVRDMQRLNDLCVLAAHHIDDANEFAIQAKAFPEDKAAQKEAVDIRNESDKVSALAEKRLQRLLPSFLRKGIHLP